MKDLTLELKITTENNTEDFVSLISKLMNILTTSSLDYVSLNIKGISEEIR